MVYMAHSDGSRGPNNVNTENYSSHHYSLAIIGVQVWERSWGGAVWGTGGL